MPSARTNGLDREWQYFLKTCHDYEITTKNRLAAFLMNVAKESGELYYFEEIADGWDYEWREDLGNTQQGDGPRYKGHGYIQTTGRLNHRKVGEALGVDFEANPLLLIEQPYPWYSAGWYWRKGSSWGNLNEYADAGDFRSTILGVRGGPDPNREHYWWTALNVLPDDVVVPEPDEVEEAPLGAAESSDELLDGWPVLRLALVGEKQWLMTQDRKKYVALVRSSQRDVRDATCLAEERRSRRPARKRGYPSGASQGYPGRTEVYGAVARGVPPGRLPGRRLIYRPAPDALHVGVAGRRLHQARLGDAPGQGMGEYLHRSPAGIRDGRRLRGLLGLRGARRLSGLDDRQRDSQLDLQRPEPTLDQLVYL
jgi:predicted chitinase